MWLMGVIETTKIIPFVWSPDLRSILSAYTVDKLAVSTKDTKEQMRTLSQKRITHTVDHNTACYIRFTVAPQIIPEHPRPQNN